MSIPFKSPAFKDDAFNCPMCSAYAAQQWYMAYYVEEGHGYVDVNNTFFCYCVHCNNFSLWHNEKLIIPQHGNIPPASLDMPDDVSTLYNEAKSIVNQSPRAAAALLRLAIEKLFTYISKEKGYSINSDIAKMVKEGLPVKIQKALDILRVVGNHAIHAGQIDFNDDSGIATQLFAILNFITESMITQPKEIDILYNRLPQKDIETIEKRDLPKP